MPTVGIFQFLPQCIKPLMVNNFIYTQNLSEFMVQLTGNIMFDLEQVIPLNEIEITVENFKEE